MATNNPAARWPHYQEDDFIIQYFGHFLSERR